MSATIFIPTLNNYTALKLCLESLTKQTSKHFEVVVISNAKDRRITNLITSFSELSIHLHIQKQPGLVAAAQEALQQATGDIFVRIDDDVVVDNSWLEQILRTLEQYTNAGAVTGPTLVDTQMIMARDSLHFIYTHQHNLFLRMIKNFYRYYICENKLYEVSTFAKSGVFSMGANLEDYIPNKIIEVQNIEACNYACRTSVLKKIGGFDMRFNKGLGEYHEADVAFKIRNLGYSILFNPRARVHHHINVITSKVRPDAYHRMQNFIIFYKRHFNSDSFDTLLRFTSYVLFQNCYYIYKFFQTGQVDQLGAIPGTLTSLIET